MRLITYDGRTQNLAAWAKEIGIRPRALWKRLAIGSGGLIFEEHEERIITIIVWHVGSACQAFRRHHGIEGSLTAVECAGPVPEEFAGAAVQRTETPILIAFNSGQFAGHRLMDFAVILVETIGIFGHPIENDELGHWHLLSTHDLFCFCKSATRTSKVPIGQFVDDKTSSVNRSVRR